MPTPATPLADTGMFQDMALQSAMTFPELLALGVAHRLDERVTLLMDFGWTGWSKLRQLTLDFANPLQADQSLALNWHDSMRAAIGAVYHIRDDADLRAGISYDETPVSRTFRSAELPDSDEIILSVGGMYRFNDRVSATLSYSYGHYAVAPVDLSLFGAGTLRGEFSRRSHALALDTRLEL